MVPANELRQNQLLATLPRAEWDRLGPLLDLVSMPLGRIINEPGSAVRNAYFPVSCSVSLLAVLKDGTTPEIATVGHEGMVGVSAFMGGDSTPSRALVKSAGYAYCMKAGMLRREFNRSDVLRQSLLLYTQALMTQFVQSAACNRRHSVQQQLCRWLLTSLDCRRPSSNLATTQELIASMLGVRREGVTAAAGKLQQAGIIRWGRGTIAVLDRPALEMHVCECYQVIKTEFDRLRPEAAIVT